MMERRLNTFVHLHDEAGERHVFGPEDELPGWAVEAIVNPDVWADGPALDLGPDGNGGDADAGGVKPVTPQEPVIPFPEEPPRAGRGSSTEAWRAYADAIGVEVPDGAGRDDIIALVGGG